LDAYEHRATAATLVPWALVEPAEPLSEEAIEKAKLFGSSSVFGCLYSGNFGKAHSYDQFLVLAEELQKDDVHFCFSVRGNSQATLAKAVQDAALANVHMVSFASESDLSSRLGAADVHLVSLREEWTGTVVPSKFFGSLATGRPVVFAGSPNSAIAECIERHQVGWTLSNSTISDVAEALRQLSREPRRVAELRRRCHSVYTEHFAKETTLDSWDALLRGSLR
jgi:colanic acid biosynthesis glycosyl transferase WcaI